MIDYIKRLIQTQLSKRGYLLQRMEHLRPPPPIYDHPKAALYNYNPGRTTLNAVRCDLNQCTNPLGQVFGLRGWHPYTQMLVEFKNHKHEQYEGSILEKYYNTHQPADARELLLAGKPEGSELEKYAPAAAVTPWDSITPGENMERNRHWMERENRREGTPLGYDEGFSAFGPVSSAKGEIEFGRLMKIYESIKQNGYIRKGHWDGDIGAFVLRRDGEYRYVIESGHHRTAAMAALGKREAPVRLKIPVIVEADDVEKWPQVQTGVWTVESALAYFNFLFDFDSKQWAADKGLLATEEESEETKESSPLL